MDVQPVRSGGSGGRPDERFPHLVAVRHDAATEGVLVSVIATVNLTARQGRIEYVHPVTNHRPSAAPQQRDVTIRSLGETGASLDEHPVEVKLSSELEPGEDRTGLVDAVLPVNGTARALELVIGGQVVDTYRVGGPPPAATAIQPVALEGSQLRVAVHFEREMEDAHTYAVQLSTDQGRTWQTIAVGLKEQPFSLDRSHLPDGHEVRVRVITTNGLSSCTVTGDPFRIGDPGAQH